MKPIVALLRPALARPAAALPRTSALVDVVTTRKVAAAKAVEKLQDVSGKTADRLTSLMTSLRKDTSGRPAAVAGSVAIRVLGASCQDRKPVPLPNLHVTLTGPERTTATATTDVTGLAVLPLAKDGDYQLDVTASDGSKVATVPTDPHRTHLVQLGDVKALEGHAVLGRGWAAALDAADAAVPAAAKAADAKLDQHLAQARARLKALTPRRDS
jgi:hypothetical protein